MKVITCQAENFGSYKAVDFTFDSKGVTLIAGPTGSGKSTLCDLIPWILFGVTAKGGKVDEILSWSGGETFGTIGLDIDGLGVQISRSRRPNDLYYRTEIDTDAEPIRGKDLQDTQKLINKLIGMDADLYLAGAYFHEFSQTASFFTTTPKNRRAITEQLVDLNLPVILQDRIKTQQKEVKNQLSATDNALFTMNAKVDILSKMCKETKNANDLWSHEQSNKVSILRGKSDNFEITKAHKIRSLENELNSIRYENPIKYDLHIKSIKVSLQPESVKCVTCGTPKINPSRDADLEKIAELETEQLENSFKLKQHKAITTQVNELKDSANFYKEQIADILTQTNPHTHQLVRLSKDLSIQTSHLNIMTDSLILLKDQELNFDLLSDAVNRFRAELVETTIKDLEALTNQHLYNYFDREIKLALTILDTDKLDVNITKDNNDASFTQLSKGQRCMLKFSFGAAVIQTIQQRHALSFNQLFFDEALDGLDDNNKLKAIKLLETLAVNDSSVYIVEHSEGIKGMIDQKINVELIDGRSEISI